MLAALDPVDIAMKMLKRLTFLIHGFCHSEMDFQNVNPAGRATIRPFLEREIRCAEQWRARVRSLAPDEGLAIITWTHGDKGPAIEYEHLARSVLGDRCFILDAPRPLEASFWTPPENDFRDGVFKELQDAWVNQGNQWNKEELDTALHSLACCHQLKMTMRKRGLDFDPASLHAAAWGATFEGCVLKFSLNFRRLLGLAQPIEIDLDLVVPDARFLLAAGDGETHMLHNNHLRLFLFRAERQSIGFFSATSYSCADKAQFVKLPVDPEQVTVLSKQGIRLWPQPEPYHLPGAGVGCYEPPQELVHRKNGFLQVPVAAGLVWRLAKAPAYVFSAPGTSHEEFRDQLLRAESLNAPGR